MKRIAYGYRRRQSDFGRLEYDHIFFDTDKSRPVLAETIRDYFYGGHGDVLVLVSEDDLPVRGPFRAALEAKGVEIQVNDLTVKKEPGRPPGFAPNQEQRAEALKIWQTPYYETHAAKLVSDLMGYEVTRYQLRRAFGDRGFKSDDE
ncbi:MAG: hypothetical protein AAGI12_15755 [Pseudomonadota bacterium]